MYKIIGADGREYGRLTVEQLHQWIREGRANAQTKVEPEGSTDWKPLAEIPEFAPTLQSSRRGPNDAAGGGRDRPGSLRRADSRTRLHHRHRRVHQPRLGTREEGFLAVGRRFVCRRDHRQRVLHPVSGDTHRVDRRRPNAGRFVRALPEEDPRPAGGFRRRVPWIQHVLRTADARQARFRIADRLGFVLCILPGIYLAVSWVFVLPLVIDKKIEFWPAMELSRKVVTKHWWLMLGFLIVLALVAIVGLLACCVGVFVAAAIAQAALMYAYEDIFGAQRPAQNI